VASLDLAEMDIRTCRGCRICFDKGEESCPLKDDLLAIRRRIEAAELLVLGSPVYVEDGNGVRLSTGGRPLDRVVRAKQGNALVRPRDVRCVEGAVRKGAGDRFGPYRPGPPRLSVRGDSVIIAAEGEFVLTGILYT
jgi:hypothetical protein